MSELNAMAPIIAAACGVLAFCRGVGQACNLGGAGQCEDDGNYGFYS